MLELVALWGHRQIIPATTGGGRGRLINWPFQSTATLAVQGWGFWLAIIGMGISIVGFWVTLVQLARTKKATAAVTDEVKRIQFSVSRYDATVETSRAENALNAARKYVRASDWGQAGEALEDLSKSLHTLRELKIGGLQSHDTEIEGVLIHSNLLCERLDKAGNAGLNSAEQVKTLSTMRDHDRIITSIRIALERSNIGE